MGSSVVVKQWFEVQIKNFAKTNSVHVWLVAHPRQMQAWKGAAPTLYDISGSAHFNNKADVGIVVHRDMLSKTDDRSEAPKLDEHPLADDPFACHIYVRKVPPPQTPVPHNALSPLVDASSSQQRSGCR